MKSFNKYDKVTVNDFILVDKAGVITDKIGDMYYVEFDDGTNAEWYQGYELTAREEAETDLYKMLCDSANEITTRNGWEHYYTGIDLAAPTCFHNWKTEFYFSGNSFTTCTKCHAKKEDT